MVHEWKCAGQGVVVADDMQPCNALIVSFQILIDIYHFICRNTNSYG